MSVCPTLGASRARYCPSSCFARKVVKGPLSADAEVEPGPEGEACLRMAEMSGFWGGASESVVSAMEGEDVEKGKTGAGAGAGATACRAVEAEVGRAYAGWPEGAEAEARGVAAKGVA